MKKVDPVEEKFSGLSRRTEELALPRGFEGRALERLRRTARSANDLAWAGAWTACRRALPLALVAAALALAIAAFSDHRLTDTVAGSVDTGLEP